MTTVLMNSNSLSNTAPLHLHFHLETTLDVTAEDARKKVNRQVITELGTGLIALAPELGLIEDRIIWRVPIALSLPDLGELGQVGSIEVDARTGEIVTDVETLGRITQHARRLFAGASLQTE